jgi:hypothetical protein
LIYNGIKDCQKRWVNAKFFLDKRLVEAIGHPHNMNRKISEGRDPKGKIFHLFVFVKY